MRLLFVLVCCIAFTSFATAQKITYHPQGRPTQVERDFDKTVRSCIAEAHEALQDENFSFADWLCTVKHYNEQMVARMTSGFTMKIASEKERANQVAILASTCDALKPAQAELKAIAKAYQKVQTGEEENVDGKAKVELDTAKELVKLTTKALEKLKINRKITRIMD
jgi:hypothetical protein